MQNLEIGGLFTPATVRGAAGQVASAVKALSREVFDFEGDIPAGFQDDWDQFTQEFLAWKDANLGFLSSVLNSTRDQLAGYVDRYTALRTRWETISGGSNAETFGVTADTVAGALEGAGTAIGKTLTNVSFGVVALGLGLLVVLLVVKKRGK